MNKRAVRVKACPDYYVLFQLLNTLRVDVERRFWIFDLEADENICDTGEDMGQTAKEVKIFLQMSHNT